MKIRIILSILFLQGCSFYQYYPGEEDVISCRPTIYDCDYDDLGDPDQQYKGKNGETYIIYNSGKKISTGHSLFRLPTEDERHIFVLDGDQIIDEYNVIQVREKSSWNCFGWLNISGHGGSDICSIQNDKRCRSFGGDEYEYYCRLRSNN